MPMESPICCTNCGALHPLPPRCINYFNIFGIEQKYDIDETALHQKYLSLSRTTHPDMVDKSSDKKRRQALSLNAEINRAYDTLRDPVKRAEYLLNLSGGLAPAEDKSVPGDMLGEVMMLREEIEEAQTADDHSSLESLKKQITDRQNITREKIALLARSLNADNMDEQKELRKNLNAIKYWDNLLDQLTEG